MHPLGFIEAPDCSTIIAALEQYPDNIVFCYVWATWCVPCRTVGPHFEELSTHYPERAVFLKIDADGCVDFLRARVIKNIPVILALRGGIEVGRLAGSPTRRTIEEFIQENLPQE